MRCVRLSFLVLMLMLAAAVLVAGCSDDDNPVDPGDEGADLDTVAPEVLGFDPAGNESGVAVDAAVTIGFSEPMDRDAVQGAVGLSTGDITGYTWADARTVTVAHTAWAEGATVTVEVGAAAADTAGNTMEAPVSSTFYVTSADLVLLASDPADGAVDVVRNTMIDLLFSAPMDPATLPAAITVRDEGLNALSFGVVSLSGDRVRLDPDQDLPAGQTITVGIGTGAQDEGGRNLSTAASFSFTTGQEVDATPPTIVAFEPADGAVVDPSTSFIRVTFSEPMDEATADPVRVSAQLMLAVEAASAQPSWNADRTVLTVPLATPLPAGLPMEATFQDFADAGGVIQTEPITWSAVVAGPTDYYPLVDGRRFDYLVSWQDGEAGQADPTAQGTGETHVQLEDQGAGVFHRVWYDAAYSVPDGDWDVMRHTSSALEFLGFHENDEGTEIDVVFDAPLTFVALPPAGTWSDATTADVPGQGTIGIEGEGRLAAQLDLDWSAGGPDGPAMFWKDVRLVVVDHVMTAGGQTVEAGVDSLWLAPTVGVVEFANTTVDSTDGTWSHEHGALVPPGER